MLIKPNIDIFFDVESLRSEENWEQIIKKEIDYRELFYLCCSLSASKSKEVEKEWKYAYETKGEDYIEPIPIDPPSIVPPPIELNKKHFNDKLL